MEDLLRAVVIAYENHGLSISDQVERGGSPFALYPVRRGNRFRALVFEVYNCLNFHVSNQVTFGISYYLTSSYPLIYLAKIAKRGEKRFFKEGSGVCKGTHYLQK